MKRFLLAGLMLFCGINAVFAACNTPVDIGFDGNQEPDDDEFLYDENQYDKVKYGYENTGGQTSGDGKGYECDGFNSAGCESGDVITMKSGHWFKGEQFFEERKYRCVAPFYSDDYWELIDDGMCHPKNYAAIPVGKWLDRTLTIDECSGYEITDQNGIEFRLLCREGPKLVCKAVKCREGMVENNGVCKLGASSDEKKGCVETKCSALSGAKYNECVACCSVSSSVAKWNGQTCNCVESGKKFDVNSKKCVVLGGGRAGDVDCSVFLNQITSLQAQCNGNTIVLEKISELKARCDSGNLSMDAFYDSWGDLQKLILEYCKPAPVVTDDPASRAAIIAAGGVLDGIVSGFDVSVWKDQEGDFNTARLASDSIAGVVLGTAGGLISSHVIKKSQIKKGFEDIQCVIAGQPVAGWGDLFQVGIQ